jgi:hypothetical protein
MLPLFDRLGNWSPQLLRELKGRLKPSSVVLAIVLSGIVQLLLLIYCYGRLPVSLHSANPYCTGNVTYETERECIRDAVGGLLINWQAWWLDTFLTISLTGSFLLILMGVYLLAQDLTQEEQRGTLNFIRLSPRSPQAFLIGKLLGVPVVLYLGVLLALPLHVGAALNGQVPISLMLSFDGVTIAACLFFYSAALLVSLVLPKLGGLQVWLSSGVVFVLLLTLYNVDGYVARVFPGNWLLMFSPATILKSQEWVNPNSYEAWEGVSWLGLPYARTLLSLLAALLLHYAALTSWIWVALGRRFRMPSATLFSKRQSYGLVAMVELIGLGFVTQTFSSPYGVTTALFYLYGFLLLNLLGLLLLALLLSPPQQAMQDWARYRRSQSRRARWSLLQDLLWAERSPMLLAMVLNVALSGAMLLAWVASWPEVEYQKRAVLAILLNSGVILVCVAIAQVMLNSRLPKREFWAIGTISGVIVLPPIALMFAFSTTSIPQSLWLFSAVPWAAVGIVPVQTVLLTLLGQFSLFGLFSLQLSQQLRKAGSSETKVLLSSTLH